MNCPLEKCKASCCYNVPFPRGFLEDHKGDIVTPYRSVRKTNTYDVPITHPDWEQNKCPFLKDDCKCNIYESRPAVCRMTGEDLRIPCPFMEGYCKR